MALSYLLSVVLSASVFDNLTINYDPLSQQIQFSKIPVTLSSDLQITGNIKSLRKINIEDKDASLIFGPGDVSTNFTSSTIFLNGFDYSLTSMSEGGPLNVICQTE